LSVKAEDPIFEKGSGESVTATASSSFATVRGQGDKATEEADSELLPWRESAVARHARSAATGTRMKVCNAFPDEVKGGDLIGRRTPPQRGAAL